MEHFTGGVWELAVERGAQEGKEKPTECVKTTEKQLYPPGSGLRRRLGNMKDWQRGEERKLVFALCYLTPILEQWSFISQCCLLGCLEVNGNVFTLTACAFNDKTHALKHPHLLRCENVPEEGKTCVAWQRVEKKDTLFFFCQDLRSSTWNITCNYKGTSRLFPILEEPFETSDFWQTI